MNDIHMKTITTIVPNARPAFIVEVCNLEGGGFDCMLLFPVVAWRVTHAESFEAAQPITCEDEAPSYLRNYMLFFSDSERWMHSDNGSAQGIGYDSLLAFCTKNEGINQKKLTVEELKEFERTGKLPL